MNVKDKIELQLNKYMVYPLYIIAIVSIFSFFRGCSTSKENVRLRKEVSTLAVQMDSLKNDFNDRIENVYTKEELNTRMEIEGLESSKRTLFDWNAVIRTTVRPDDRMNDYDNQIKALERELE